MNRSSAQRRLAQTANTLFALSLFTFLISFPTALTSFLAGVLLLTASELLPATATAPASDRATLQ